MEVQMNRKKKRPQCFLKRTWSITLAPSYDYDTNIFETVSRVTNPHGKKIFLYTDLYKKSRKPVHPIAKSSPLLLYFPTSVSQLPVSEPYVHIPPMRCEWRLGDWKPSLLPTINFINSHHPPRIHSFIPFPVQKHLC